MELTEQERRKLEKSTAESHGSLSLGLLATALLPDALWQILTLVIIAAFFGLSSIYIYLVLRFRCKRRKIFVKATQVRIKHVVWFLGVILLGIGLLQTGCVILILLGGICIGIGYSILIVGNLINLINLIKEVQDMGTKGRKNVKKPKQKKEKKEKKK